jgi:hypothetical protein
LSWFIKIDPFWDILILILGFFKNSFSKNIHYYKKKSGSSCGFICGKLFPADFHVVLPAETGFLRNFLRLLMRNYLRIIRRNVCYSFIVIFGKKFRRKVSCGFQKPQETIREPESAGNSAGNVFPTDFLPISAGNMQISSSVCMRIPFDKFVCRIFFKQISTIK